MSQDDDRRSFHQKRATEEFDRAIRTSNMEASRAHMKLSALHFEAASETHAALRRTDD
ncbi:hypothetical protein [Sphingomonas jatrophae]|uniref:Uncharacterized protein n=1 Tax=Sphingomonas jatrophae TaxID=1166337 RepID=A0A1I6JNK8_9SPHN|nr:hypothetical protein [Sphingomonas jatrophae]SFR80491.1 hypothetical protein SAMN05192580_0582 [Sphingomonas jatrophae]